MPSANGSDVGEELKVPGASWRRTPIARCLAHATSNSSAVRKAGGSVASGVGGGAAARRTREARAVRRPQWWAHARCAGGAIQVNPRSSAKYGVI